MTRKWELLECDNEKINEISQKHNVSKILAKVLYNRGFIEDDCINRFLNPSIEDLNNPFLLNDMDMAVTRIVKAISSNERITIYGDYDVDGITSITVLYKFLKELGADVYYYLPSRLDEGYGLNNDAIAKIKNDNTTLIITVDCGISANKEVDYANSCGIDVIITDHHECPEVLPNAYAIINPKRDDSNYPFKFLAGVGVAFKLIHAISINMNLDRKKYLKYIDIVALGTVSDIVPLKDENRIIVKFGLILMKETKNIGLKALISSSGFSTIDSNMISFGLAPRINACGRMGNADLALELLLTDDIERANKIALELNAINRERQDVEKSIYEEAVKIIEEEKIYENNVIVLGKEGWHHGVIGIVASKITEMYYKPSILICFEDGIGKGSGRSVDGFDLHEALNKCSNDLIKYGGHEMAIGLTIDKINFEQFQSDINEYAKNVMELDKTPSISIDAKIDADNVSLDFVEELRKLEPFGEENPIPVFLYKDLKVNAIRLLSNDKHLKLVLKDNDDFFDAIAFNMGYLEYSIKVGDKIDVVTKIDINSFGNSQKLQLNIKDIKKSI